MRVIVSAGYGKLFFHETVREIAAAGAEVDFITGWVPEPGSERFVNSIGKLIGERSLYRRMRSRAIEDPGVRMRPVKWVEFTGYGLNLLSKLRLMSYSRTTGWSFEMAGWASRKYLRDADIFHVRSGAGQGGAIRTAKSRGLKILTDQSIAHPAYMKQVLDEEYLRAGVSVEDFGDGGLWRLVLEDCSQGDRLVVNSDFVKRTFVEKGYSADKIDVVYLGVREAFINLKQNYAADGPVRLLYTGTFSLRKGARTLLESVRSVRAGGLDVRLQVIGHMGDGKTYVQESDAEFLTHTTFLPPAELLPALSTSDMYVFPTLAEGCARSAMEAGAAGLPVITTESCGLPFVDGKSVVYTPVNDAFALAEAISRLAGSATLRETIGRGSARAVELHYTWKNYGEAMLRLYQNLVS